MQMLINMTGKNYTKVGTIKIERANKIEKNYIDIIRIYKTITYGEIYKEIFDKKKKN